ncbi:MAG: Acyl-coenzyme thioesterase [Frankiales bacterium]|nr:Acyl-coenzyme thioesterase [Frankiales bacterium]
MSEELVRSHLRSVVGQIDTDVLPAHYPTCLGCGPDAEHGFHLQVRRDGDDVVTRHVFSQAQSGAPGIAHGGAVATVVDDLLGYLLYVVRKPGVTRKLEVEYLKPVFLGQEYEVRGRVESVDGRKLWVSCTGTAPDGVLAFRGSGLFLEVPLSHFAQADKTSGGGQSPVAL